MTVADPSPDADYDPRPRDLDAEQSVLGAMILSERALVHARTVLASRDFYRPWHQELFTALGELYDDGHPTDVVSLADAFRRSGLLNRMGGITKLHALVEDVTGPASIEHWCSIVSSLAMRGRMLELLPAIHRKALSGDSIDDVIAGVRNLVDHALDAGDSTDDDDGVWLADAIDDEMSTWDDEQDAGIPTGFADVDDVVDGLKPGQLVLVAARPGIGKSVLSTDWIRSAARQGYSSLLFSLEMPRRDVMQRLIAATAKVRLADIRSRTLDDESRYRMELARAEMHKFRIRIEDRHAVSLARVRSIAREMKRSDAQLHLLVVDYIQLMTPSDPSAPRREQVDALSRGLKGLAKELSIPVVALAQLNRGPETRNDKKPAMSDLRESGSLEQDADLIFLINRPDAAQREDPRAGEADLILAKHRNGPTATIPIAHQLHYARFADLARG